MLTMFFDNESYSNCRFTSYFIYRWKKKPIMQSAHQTGKNGSFELCRDTRAFFMLKENAEGHVNWPIKRLTLIVFHLNARGV